MNNTFNVGDFVSVIYFDMGGRITAIKQAPIHVRKFFDDPDEFLLYTVEVSPGRFITTTADGLESIKPERVSE